MTTVSPITLPTNAVPVQSPQTTVANTQVQTPVPAQTTAANLSASRLLSDPLSGIVITQYLDTRGNVASQTPAAAVVAYLRNGLTEEGFPKNSSTSATA